LKVSIVTVAYNSQQHIEDTIKSVLSQSYNKIEYIIIDGASKDNTINIVNKYKDKISCIISEPDKGIYDAMNKGIDNATGDIIGFLNSDDIFYDNEVVANIVNGFDEKTDCIIANIAFVKSSDLNSITRKYSSNKFKPYWFRFGHMPPHPSFYARNTVYKNIILKHHH
jgi:glycosyltransferase involved in cell wall biosynthesis